jgi:hypothetical protein
MRGIRYGGGGKGKKGKKLSYLILNERIKCGLMKINGILGWSG